MLIRRKLSRTSFALLSLSVACALGAGLMMRAYAQRLDATRPDGGPPIDVVVTTREIDRGAVLSEDSVTVLTVPERFAPPGAVRDPERAVGRIVVAPLAEGEVLTRLRLAGGGSGPTAATIPAGMRAVQVPVAFAVGVRPGDLVDVIATFGGGGAHTELTGEGLEVVRVERGGAGGSFGAAGTSSSSSVGLVLLVTPSDAERLAFASAFATLSIAVRGPEDASASPVPSFLDG
jgi:pilus assembly protein CpaB